MRRYSGAEAPTTDRPQARARRWVSGSLVRTGLVIAFICKLALMGVWYAGGLSAAVALATEATANRLPDGAKGGAAAGKAGAAAEKGASASAEAAGGSSAGATGAKVREPRVMVEAITRRQAELEARERELASREAQLKIYEQDVTAKIASLEEIEKRLQAHAKAASAAIDAAAESLAKVYAAMKPGEAAPILERLDETTVLTIFGRMKEKQIGEILPLMSKEKAIALTQALAVRASR